MKTKIALAALTMLAACTTITEVTPAGDGNYTVTTQVRGGMTPWGEVKASRAVSRVKRNRGLMNGS